MTKAEMKVLEKAFAAEVEGRLPFQARSELAHKLAKEGYLQDFETWFGQVRVKGWQLTHLGRLTYCASCDSPDENAAPQARVSEAQVLPVAVDRNPGLAVAAPNAAGDAATTKEK